MRFSFFVRKSKGCKVFLQIRQFHLDKTSPHPYNVRVLATLAQLVEHLIRNERVVGSNPISGSK